MYSVDDVASFESVEETMYHLRHDLGSDRPFILVANKIDLVRNRKVSPEGKSISLLYLVVKIEKWRRHKDVINRQRLVMRDNHAQLLKNRDGSSTFTLVNDISN